MRYQLAELNIAKLRAPLDTPLLADFVNGLARINATADHSDGFVWRLMGDGGDDATALRPFPDAEIIVNMSVWQNVEALQAYTYASDHVDFFRRRAEWFDKLSTPAFVLWWIPQGHIPTLAEAKTRLDALAAHGPTPYAFTFRQRYTVEDWLAHPPQPTA
jgi:hypothetical protein